MRKSAKKSEPEKAPEAKAKAKTAKASVKKASADRKGPEGESKSLSLQTWDEGARRRALLRRWERSQQRPHSTGMVDYGLWVRMFNAAPAADEEPFRRGLIWH